MRPFGMKKPASRTPAARLFLRSPCYTSKFRPVVNTPSCGSGGTGRRASLRSLFSQESGGSNPLFRTNSQNYLSKPVIARWLANGQLTSPAALLLCLSVMTDAARSARVMRMLARVVTAMAAVEGVICLYVLAFGGIRVDAGPLRISAGTWRHPFTQAIVLALLAAWLYWRDAVRAGRVGCRAASGSAPRQPRASRQLGPSRCFGPASS